MHCKLCLELAPKHKDSQPTSSQEAPDVCVTSSFVTSARVKTIFQKDTKDTGYKYSDTFVLVCQEAAADLGSGNLCADEEVGHLQPSLLPALLQQVLQGPAG